MLTERVVEWTRDWKEQGLQEGRQIGLQEGLQQGARDSVLAVLEMRFGRVPLDIAAAIGRLEDVGLLYTLLRRASVTNSLADFERALAASDD